VTSPTFSSSSFFHLPHFHFRFLFSHLRTFSSSHLRLFSALSPSLSSSYTLCPLSFFSDFHIPTSAFCFLTFAPSHLPTFFFSHLPHSHFRFLFSHLRTFSSSHLLFFPPSSFFRPLTFTIILLYALPSVVFFRLPHSHFRILLTLTYSLTKDEILTLTCQIWRTEF